VSAVKQVGEFVKDEDELKTTPAMKMEPVRPRVTSEERKLKISTKGTSIQGVSLTYSFILLAFFLKAKFFYSRLIRKLKRQTKMKL